MSNAEHSPLPTDLSRERMQDYFRLRENDPQLTLSSLKKFPRGQSRETFFSEYQLRSGATRKQVIRRNLPTGSGSTCMSTLRQEYEIYRRLGKTAVPVAKAYWYEDDPQWLNGGGEFYIRELVEGSFDVPGFFVEDPRFDDYRIAISKEHMSKLALIHTCDWRAAGLGELFPVPSGVEDCAQVTIEQIIRDIDSVRMEPMPLATEAADWLLQRAPVAPRVSFLKGTNGYGEEVFRDGKIVAMSDWELASIGDPAHDFAHLQDFIPTIVRDGKEIWGLQQALDHYESCSGIHIEPASVDYYRGVHALGMLAYCSNDVNKIENFSNVLVRHAWNATEVLHLGKLVLGARMGLIPPLDPNRFAQMR
jgi:aminoglycoside phosphotransferase (APT) family kinase protein